MTREEREFILDIINCLVWHDIRLPNEEIEKAINVLKAEPCEEQESKTGHCKDCKYFEYDSVAKIYKVPVIVAHEICSKWGDGCKTKEDGHCFLFEPLEREDKEGESE